MKQINILMLLILFIFAGCGVQTTPFPDPNAIKSYKDIPGITEAEISAIEALKEQKYKFLYGHLFETESFRLPDGTYAGFTIKFCELLSTLFDKEFAPVHFYDWESLKLGIDNLSIDFSGDFTTTSEQREAYYMTSPIAGRALNIYTLKNSAEILSELNINGMKIGFLTGTVAAGIIKESYPELSFEVVDVAKVSVAAEMLKNGEVDAFVMDEVMDLEFERYDFIHSKRFFSLVRTPVSLTTANPELQPLISVVNKYLSAGGINKLAELYSEGAREYTKYKLHQSFSPEERAYMDGLASQNAKVAVGIQYDYYPVSFYNERSREFQGIGPDILSEVTKLTGIEFEPVKGSTDTPFDEFFVELRDGRVSMVTELLYTDSRKNDYIWSSIPYHTTHYALLSRSDYPDLAMHEVFYAKVGTVSKFAHEEMFNSWFPGHGQHMVYETTIAAFDALERGDIDLLMLAENMLLGQTNYREKPGFKINITFEKKVESFFGYNKNEEILCSIIDKSLHYIDTGRFSQEWVNKTFDFSKKIAQMQTIYVSIFAFVVVLVLLAVSLLFWKNRQLGRHLLMAVDEAREASKAKSQFLANMSHEIRTPMNAVIGMTELLVNESLSDRQRGYVNDINMSAHSLLTIINDILDLSKIESGKMELVPVDYNFHAFINNISSIFRFVVEKKGLEFKFEEVGEMPKCLFGDDIRLRQILMNLCGNAVKFTHEGSIRLKVTATAECLIFEISDTGIGIRKEDIARLFESFTQADTRKNRSITGTGLGLPISKAFVEMMGGSLIVNSVYGQGSTFTVTVPWLAGNPAAIQPDDGKMAEGVFSASTAKILVVDDNEVNLRVASGLFNLFNISIKTVLSGKEALQAVQEADYDIVFMDHMMPEMDGVETTDKIRALGGKYEHLTIIALTANAIHGAKEMFLANGFDGFLSKPIEINDLVAVLRRWLPAERFTEESEPLQSPPAARKDDLPPPQSEFITAMKAIHVLDTETGLSHVFGLEDMYRETVEVFFQSLLTECSKLDNFLHDKNLHSFAILVHGMKSSLATIGATPLAETAYALEKASKSEDLPYCQEHFPGFSAELHSLHEKLSVVIHGSIPQQPAGQSKDYLQEKLQSIWKAVDSFDSDTSVDILNELLECEDFHEQKVLLESARDALRDFDFNAAIDYLNELHS